jgi:hypothetical protein
MSNHNFIGMDSHDHALSEIYYRVLHELPVYPNAVKCSSDGVLASITKKRLVLLTPKFDHHGLYATSQIRIKEGDINFTPKITDELSIRDSIASYFTKLDNLTCFFASITWLNMPEFTIIPTSHNYVGWYFVVGASE